MIWIILGIGIVITGVCMALSNQKQKRLAREGKITARRSDFTEYAEDFILGQCDPAQITEGLDTLPYGEISAEMTANHVNQIFTFKGADWSARLWRKAADGCVYRFEFTDWTVRNGVPQSFESMNRMLTAVEKMFMSIDPGVRIEQNAPGPADRG